MPVSGPTSTNQLPGFYTTPAAAGSPTQTGGVETAANAQKQRSDAAREAGGLSRQAAAGETAYAAAMTDGMDWDALARDGSLAASVSVSINAIMLMLIQVSAEMKKGAKAGGLADDQAGLQFGLDAAKKMEEAAEKKYQSAMIQAGVAMAMGFVQMKYAYKAQGMANKNASEGAIGAVNGKGQSFQAIGNAAAKLGTAGLDRDAALDEAASQALRAVAEYIQARAKKDYDLASQANDIQNKAFAFMSKISDVQHEAQKAIYGV